MTDTPKPRKRTKKASAEKMLPQVSRVGEIRGTGPTEEPATLDLTARDPAYILRDPDEPIEPDEVPGEIRDAVIAEYGEEFFHEIEWTWRKVSKLRRAITHPRENLTNSIAQVCGPHCTIREGCPYDILGRPPVGLRCPIELRLADMLTADYITAVQERLNVDRHELVEDLIYFNLIRGLVETDVVENRLNGSLSANGFITEVPTVINEETGEVYYREEESVAMRIKARVEARKDKLYRQLLATPEMAAKYRRKGEEDRLAKVADVLDRLDKFLVATTITDAEVTGE